MSHQVVVDDAMPYAQKLGQPIRVTLKWSEHHTGAFNLSVQHALHLRNELNAKLAEHHLEMPYPHLLTTAGELDAMPVGTLISDREHDDWKKVEDGEWLHGIVGPTLRAESLAVMWPPFAIVSVPGVEQ